MRLPHPQPTFGRPRHRLAAQALIALLLSACSFIMTLTLLGTADTGLGAKCSIADDRDSVWVCDPMSGHLFHIKHTFPSN